MRYAQAQALTAHSGLPAVGMAVLAAGETVISTGAPSSSLLIRLLKGEGGAAEWQNDSHAPTA